MDIDETLLHASETPLEFKHDFIAGQYFVYLRPYLQLFLEFAFQHFDVAVWTSSNETYANHVVSRVFRDGMSPRFVWSRHRCTTKFDPETWQYDYIKDLKKVKRKGFPLASVIMVDNTPKKLRRNYGNLVTVKSFYGDQRDEELLYLMPYLEELEKVDNIRSVEKRGWSARQNLSAKG